MDGGGIVRITELVKRLEATLQIEGDLEVTFRDTEWGAMQVNHVVVMPPTAGKPQQVSLRHAKV